MSTLGNALKINTKATTKDKACDVSVPITEVPRSLEGLFSCLNGLDTRRLAQDAQLSNDTAHILRSHQNSGMFTASLHFKNKSICTWCPFDGQQKFNGWFIEELEEITCFD